MGRQGRRTLTALGSTLALFLGVPQAASAVDWRPIGTSCVNTSGGECIARAAFSGAWNVAVSPDRRHAYVAAYNDSAIHILDLDAATGKLTPKTGSTSCWSAGGSGGACSTGAGLNSVDSMVFSPNGDFLYVSGWGGSIAIFGRNPATGLLTQLPGNGGQDGCITDVATAGCVDGRGLANAGRSLVISPDGANVYAGTNPIAVFDRNPVTGVLTQKLLTAGCVMNGPVSDGCAATSGLGPARQAAITSNGANLYMPTGNGVAIFSRGPGGTLVPNGCLSSNGSGGACAADARLTSGLETVAIGPGDGHLYAAMDGGMATLARAGGGGLSVQSCLSDGPVAGCTRAQNVGSLNYLAVSPDGADVVVNHSTTNGGLVMLSRNPATGALAPHASPDGCISASGSGLAGGMPLPGFCRSYLPMGFHGHVAFINNSWFVAGFWIGSSVATFKRDFYPQCAAREIAVPHNTLVTVPLACSDANGDPLALSIAQPPLSGSLGAIDAAQARVNYSPFGGFSGADSFTYEATGGALVSPPARVGLAVAAPPVQPPPKKRITSKVRVTWGVSGKRIFLLRLSATKVPKGGKLELRCRGKKCPFKRKSSKKRRSGRITLFREIKASKVVGQKARKFRAKQRLEVRITAPTYIGKVVRYKLKRGKIPSGKTLCLPVGATKPRSRCT